GAAEPGVQARGLGLTELGGHHHRCAARRQDRPRPRRGWTDHLGGELLHEVPASAAGGLGGTCPGGGLHQRRYRALRPSDGAADLSRNRPAAPSCSLGPAGSLPARPSFLLDRKPQLASAVASRAPTASRTRRPMSASTFSQYWKARSRMSSERTPETLPEMFVTKRSRAASSITSRTRVPG